MGRHISTKWSTIINAKVIINHVDGSATENTYKVDDMVENLGYVDNGELIYITGRVSKILTQLKNKPVVKNTTEIQDTSIKDIKIPGINIDCSEHFASNVLTLDVMEIVENSGIENVTSVRVIPELSVDLTVSTEDDGDIVLDGLVVGSHVAFDTKSNGSVNGIITKFLYKNTDNGVKTTALVVATDDKKVCVFKFGDIIGVLRESETNDVPLGESKPVTEPIKEEDTSSDSEKVEPEIETEVSNNVPLSQSQKSSKKKKNKHKSIQIVTDYDIKDDHIVDNTVINAPNIIEPTETESDSPESIVSLNKDIVIEMKYDDSVEAHAE